MCFNISIFFNTLSNLSRLLVAESLTIALKHSLSNENNIESFVALIEAARGALYNNANSPKLVPGSYVLTFN